MNTEAEQGVDGSKRVRKLPARYVMAVIVPLLAIYFYSDHGRLFVPSDEWLEACRPFVFLLALASTSFLIWSWSNSPKRGLEYGFGYLGLLLFAFFQYHFLSAIIVDFPGSLYTTYSGLANHELYKVTKINVTVGRHGRIIHCLGSTAFKNSVQRGYCPQNLHEEAVYKNLPQTTDLYFFEKTSWFGRLITGYALPPDASVPVNVMYPTKGFASSEKFRHDTDKAVRYFLADQHLSDANETAVAQSGVVDDLDGDGHEEVILLWNIAGPTYGFSNLSVFNVQPDGLKQLASVKLEGDATNLAIKGSTALVEEQVLVGKPSATCCEKIAKTVRFKWKDGQLEQLP